MEITECPTALERDLNPPNTSQCPPLPHSLWDRPLYFSFSRKFASSSLGFFMHCVPLDRTGDSGLLLKFACGGFSHLCVISVSVGVHLFQSVITQRFGKCVCKSPCGFRPTALKPARQTSRKKTWQVKQRCGRAGDRVSGRGCSLRTEEMMLMIQLKWLHWSSRGCMSWIHAPSVGVVTVSQQLLQSLY